MSPDEKIAHRAAKQHGLVTTAQALEARLTPDALRHRVRRGRLIRLDRAVLIVSGALPTFEQSVMAAVLAVGPRASASFVSAAMLYGVLEKGQHVFHVTAPERHRARKGIVIHEAQLGPRDIRKVANIPVTCPNRTIVDLASLRNERMLEAALDEAIRLGLTTIPTLRRYIAGRGLGANRGMACLRKLLDDREHGAMHSELERMFRRKLEATDLPRPRRQLPIGPYKVDFAWPAKKIVVELDGLGGHFSAEEARRGKKRDRVIIRAGYTPLHFGWTDVDLDWPSVEADLRDLLID